MKKEDLAAASGIKGILRPSGAIALLESTGSELITQASSIEFTKEDVAAKKIPSSYLIKNVPWHQQLDGLSCAAGALETVFHYWGADIDQKEIMNVARTSSSGTLSHDVVRTGHFSMLSEAQGNYFPSYGPKAGFRGRKIGYGAFSRTSENCWFDDLKALISDDIPVILLMSFEPTGGGGHYRVATGYDDARQLIFFCEPWGRESGQHTEWTGITAWSYADFETAWDYSEAGVEQPYYGSAIIPWAVDIDVKGKMRAGSMLTLAARISYPCPQPFDSSQFSARDVIASISLPEGMKLVRGSSDISLGALSAGTQKEVSWKMLCSTDPVGRCVSVSAGGIVSGSVPEDSWQGQSVSYPAYSYIDMIGGRASFKL